MLKKASLLLVFLVLPLFTSALVHIGGDYFLKGAESASDDIYILAETSAITGTVEGDITSLASHTISEATTTADALIIGSQVTLGGTVGDDARLVGETITLSGTVADDVIAIGVNVIVLPSASIVGNLYVVGGEVSIEGTVLGDVRVLAQRSKVGGTIAGNLELWGETEILPEASIDGDFIYHSKSEVDVPESAHIGGSLLFDNTEGNGLSLGNAGTLFGGFFSLYTIMLLALGFLLFFLFRDRTEEVLLEILPKFWPRLLRGILIVVSGPVLVAVLIGSIIGIPIAVVLFSVYLSFLVLGSAFSALTLGAWFERLLFKRSTFPLTYRPVLTGTIALSLLGSIPLVGFPIHLILLFASVGGIGTVFYRYAREIR